MLPLPRYERHIQSRSGARFDLLMINSAITFNRGRAVDRTSAAMEEMERYCTAHPQSPAALRRPKLSIRGRTIVALLGPAIEEGIVGFGDTVQAALRAFDAQYSVFPLSDYSRQGVTRSELSRLPQRLRRRPFRNCDLSYTEHRVK